MNELINMNLTMSSLEIAKLTGKEHDKVIRDLKELDKQGVIVAANFGGIYKDSLNREQPLYNLPKRETLILTSGYSAKQRAGIIDRWLALEEAGQPKTTGDMLVQMAQAFAALERKQLALQAEQAQLAERQRITEGKLEDFANGAEHFSITAYNKLFLQNSISNSQANEDGRKISKLCKNQGIELGIAPHPVWGTVNTYPKAMLDAYYSKELH